MADLDPLPTFSPPSTLDDKPCLTSGHHYTFKCDMCQFYKNGKKQPGCIFYPRSYAAGLTRTKEQYTKYSKPKMKEPVGFHFEEMDA